MEKKTCLIFSSQPDLYWTISIINQIVKSIAINNHFLKLWFIFEIPTIPAKVYGIHVPWNCYLLSTISRPKVETQSSSPEPMLQNHTQLCSSKHAGSPFPLCPRPQQILQTFFPIHVMNIPTDPKNKTLKGNWGSHRRNKYIP